MLKIFVILSFLMSSFLFGLTESIAAQTKVGNKKLSAKLPKPNSPPKIEAINLSKTVITIICAEGQIPEESDCDSDSSVKISTLASDKDGDQLRYIYTISVGRILGDGAEVTWDLAGVKPGIYPLAVRVADNRKGFVVKTKEIEVKECKCQRVIGGHPCPAAMSVSSYPEETVAAGETLIFTFGFMQGVDEPKFKWTVSAGKIVEGQDTPLIKVDTTGLSAQEITATVELVGVVKGCKNTASATATIK